MKKLMVAILSLLSVFLMTGCATQAALPTFSPEEKQIRNICDLATLKCYYHNVAKLHKDKGEGVSHWFEKERDYWIEYTGYAKIGIDMSQVTMSCDGSDITIHIPPAKVICVDVVDSTLTEASYYVSEDGFINPNKITPADQSLAINNAQEEMKASAQSNTALLLNAQNRAKELIETYIQKLAEASGVAYHVTWVDIEGTAVVANEAP